MATIPRILALVLFAALLSAAAQSTKGNSSETGSAQTAKPDFSIAASTPSTIIKAGSQLVVNVVLTNTSDHPITLDNTIALDFNESDYSTVVEDETGKSAPKTKFGLMLMGDESHLPKGRETNDVTLTVQPAGVLRAKIDVTKLYDLRQPGRYTVQVARFDHGTNSWAKSNILAVTVTP